MDQTITILVLFEGFLLALWTAWRFGIFSPVTFYVGFLTIDISVFAWIFFTRANKSDFLFTAMPWPDFSPVYSRVVYLYMFLLLIGLLAIIGIKPRQGRDKKFSWEIRLIIEKSGRKTSVMLFLLALFSLLLEVIHFVDVDKNIFWEHQTYGMLREPVLAGIETTIGRLIHLSIRQYGLLLVGISVFLFVAQYYSWSVIFALLGVYPFLLATAQNSRWAPLYLFASAILFIMIGGIRRYFPHILVSFLLGMVFFLKVLVGRGTPFQGLSGIEQVFSIVFSRFGSESNRWLVGFLLNMFQGAQGLANAFLIGPNYPELYKLLSFSPTISAFDGFDKIKDTYLIRIGPAVPMNSFAEAYFFGVLYFFVFCLILVLWIRMMTVMSLRKDLFSVPFMVLSYYTMLRMSQYILRDGIRFVYLGLLAGWIINWFFTKPNDQIHVKK